MTLAIASKLPLKLGMTNAAVKEAQEDLAARNYPLLGTGYYGPKTAASVKTFQTVRGLSATGVIDIETARVLDLPVPKTTPIITANPPWLSTAIKNIGIAEFPGNADNPVILAMAKKCGGNIAATYKHDATAWCKMFTEYCLAVNGFKGVDSLWALDNLKLGVKLSGPAVGAIATKKRTGGGHTFDIIGKDKNGRIVAVGGNQGDRVSRATFSLTEIVGYNWPNGYPLPTKTGISSLPIVDSAPLSRYEA